MDKKFHLKKDTHEITTTSAVEAVEWRARGYADVKEGKAEKPAPAPQVSTRKPADKK